MSTDTTAAPQGRKITLTEALSEIKRLNARINKAISTFIPVAVSTEEQPTPAGFTSLDHFERSVRADYASVNDLIGRRRKLKAKLLRANATTEVKFPHPASGEEVCMTIAEVIDLKDNLRDVEANLLGQMQRALGQAEQVIARTEQELTNAANAMANTRLGSGAAKVSPDQMEQFRASLRKSAVGVLRDPLNIREEAKKRDEALTEFLRTIDVQLSVANATTLIEVD